MIYRVQENYIKRLLAQFPVTAIIGPRQCGKTTLAKKLALSGKTNAIYFDLESPSDFSRFNDPEFFLQSLPYNCIIIDEVQRKPELFAILRSLVDKKKRKGNYLLLGSAAPDLVRGVSESLAGRIAYTEAHPLNLSEVIKKPMDINKHWFRGGFPDAWLCKNDKEWFIWMDSFFRTFIERDLNSLFGVNFSSVLMYKLWRMLAHYHGQIWNANTFAKGLDVSPTTINKYLDYLEGAFMIRRLPAYYTNAKKRLVKSARVYIRDSGLLHYLLEIYSARQLVVAPAVGYSWEGYALEQILQLIPLHMKAYFYRTHDGTEMDLVITKGLKPVACVELKTTNNPQLSRGFYESLRDIKCKFNFVVTPQQPTAYKLDKTTTVCGLSEFLHTFLPKIVKQK